MNQQFRSSVSADLAFGLFDAPSVITSLGANRHNDAKIVLMNPEFKHVDTVFLHPFVGSLRVGESLELIDPKVDNQNTMTSENLCSTNGQPQPCNWQPSCTVFGSPGFANEPATGNERCQHRLELGSDGDSITTMTTVRFVGNTAHDGGAIYVNDTSFTLERSSVLQNSARPPKASSTSTHGDVHRVWSDCRSDTPQERTTTAWEECVDTYTPAYRDDKRVCMQPAVSADGTPSLEPCDEPRREKDFENTLRFDEGATYQCCRPSALLQTSVVVADGKTIGSGGGIFVTCTSACRLAISHVHFGDNTADDRGGAICIENAELYVLQTTFVDNRARTGGAIWVNMDVPLAVQISHADFNLASLPPSERSAATDITIGTFTGIQENSATDPGLILTGEFEYAVDVGGVGGPGLRDVATFTQDTLTPGVTVSEDNRREQTRTHIEYGDDLESNNMETILSTCRGSDTSSKYGYAFKPITLAIGDLDMMEAYRIQLIFSLKSPTSTYQGKIDYRGGCFDIDVDGTTIIESLDVRKLQHDANMDAGSFTLQGTGGETWSKQPADGVYVRFNIAGTETTSISLVVRNPQDCPGTDVVAGNPYEAGALIQAFTVENLQHSSSVTPGLYATGHLNLTITNSHFASGDGYGLGDGSEAEDLFLVAEDLDALRLYETEYDHEGAVEIIPTPDIAACATNPCPRGYGCQQSVGYSLSCIVCPPGTISPDGISCTQCDSGHGPNPERNACQLCPAQMYSNCDTSSVCTTCALPGEVDETRTSCSAPRRAFSCQPGTRCPVGGLCQNTDDCEMCPPGSVSATGQQCTPCEKKGRGRAANPEQTDCILCKPGTQTESDHSGCRPCAAQEYSNDLETGLQCHSCDFPRVVNSNQTRCTKCSRGSGPDPSRKTCVQCTDRDFGTGDDVCRQCPDNKVTLADNSGCKDCGAREVAVDGVCRCAPDYYDTSTIHIVCHSSDCESDAAHGSGCEPCPPCIRCPVGPDGKSSVQLINAGFGLPKAWGGHSLTQIVQRGDIDANVTVYPCPLAEMCLGDHFALPAATVETYINDSNVAQFLRTTEELEGDIPAAVSNLLNLAEATGITSADGASERLNSDELHSMELEQLKGLLRTYYLEPPDASMVMTDNAMYLLSHIPGFTQPHDETQGCSHYSCREGHDELSPLCALCDENYAGGSTVVCNDCQSTAIVWRLVQIVVALVLAYILIIRVPMKLLARRRGKQDAIHAFERDGFVLVGEAEDDQASIQVYTKILMSHFQVRPNH
jgi:predicted outer membrane repeat protein